MLKFRSDYFHAVFWMLGSVFAFTVMAVAGRSAMLELDTFEVMMYRSFTGVAIIAAFIFLTNRQSEITTKFLPQHLVRNLFHFSGQNLWFAALAMIPLAQVFAIEFTSPIWVLLLSPLILGESLTKGRVLTALIGFVGILIVTRPSVGTLSIGEGFAALAAICFALTGLLTRRLTRTQSITAILFYLTVTQAVFGLITAGYDGNITIPSIQTIPSVVVIGLMGLLAHLCLTRALSLAPAASIMPIDFTRLPIIAIVGYLLYNEKIDVFVILGALIIFGANYFNVRHENRMTGLTTLASRSD